MFVSDLFHDQRHDFRSIVSECATFIAESASIPVYKILPASFLDIHRVKVRKRRRTNPTLAEAFDGAFGDQYRDILQRSVTVSAQMPSNIPDGYDLFYVLLPSGFRYMYNNNTSNIQENLSSVVGTLAANEVTSLAPDVIRATFTDSNLVSGLCRGAEVLLYNVPHYYAVRVKSSLSYTDALAHIK